jgi:hypothetical protein
MSHHRHQQHQSENISPVSHFTISQQEQALLNNKNTINQIAKDMILLNRATSGQAVVAPTSSGNSAAVTKTQSIRNQYIMSDDEYAELNNNVNTLTRLDDIESAILRSTVPIDLNETEEITVNGERGIWANRNEVTNWRGNYPISKYPINDDPNPEIIRKRTDQHLVYHQEVAIRYLRPPTPPAPGEILIQQEGNSFAPPAPPLVIRQQPARPVTPPPLVVREAPPPPPPAVGRKGKTIKKLTVI